MTALTVRALDAGAAGAPPAGRVAPATPLWSVDDPRSVLGKVRLILEAFQPGCDSVSVAHLVEHAGLSKTTAHRLCQELVRWGVLERAGSDYRLGLHLWELGQRVPRQRTLREAALPYLEDLVVSTRETVHCAILDGTEVVYIEKLSLQRRQPRPSSLGGRLPLHCTATGKALLAWAPRRVLDRVLAKPLVRLAPRTITSPDRLVAELEQVRRRGYATEHEETRVGYMSLAAPVVGAHGILVGAVSVTAPTSSAASKTSAPAVVAAAAGIGRTLQAEGALPPR